MARVAWGIEAGASSVKAVQLSRDSKGGVSLQDFVILPLSAYHVPGADHTATLLAAFTTLVQEKGIKRGDSVYLSIAGRNAFSRVVTLPPVGEDAIRQTIINEAKGQIPISLNEAVWDYQHITSEDEDELQVNLYAVKRDVVDTYINACKAAGLPLDGIQLAPLGIYNFVKFELDAMVSQACVCIDIGAENTDLLIIDGERTWLRVIPSAGNDITKAMLMKFKKLSPLQAEQLKRKAARSKNAAAIFDAIKPPLKELVGEIHRSVGFYKSQNEEVALSKLVIMGNGSKLFNIEKFLEQQLQYEIVSIKELTNIEIAPSLDLAEVQKNVQSLCVPIGLALQAIDVPGLTSTNLLPADLLVEESLQKARSYALLAGVAVFLAGLVSLLMGISVKSSGRDLLAQLGQEEERILERENDLARFQERDPQRYAEFVTLQNIDRGEELPYLSHLFVSQLLSDYQKENGNDIHLLLCSRIPREDLETPRLGDYDQAGFIVKLEKDTFEKISPAAREDFSETGVEEVSSYGRFVKVVMQLNLAVNLKDPGLQEDMNKAYEKTSQRLKDMLEERLQLLFRVKDQSEESRLKAFKEVFGKDQNFLDAMLRLQKIIEVEKSEEEVSEMIVESGTLKGQRLDMGSLFDIAIHPGNLPSKASKDYFHFTFTFAFESRPWVLSSQKEENL